MAPKKQNGKAEKLFEIEEIFRMTRERENFFFFYFPFCFFYCVLHVSWRRRFIGEFIAPRFTLYCGKNYSLFWSFCQKPPFDFVCVFFSAYQGFLFSSVVWNIIWHKMVENKCEKFCKLQETILLLLHFEAQTKKTLV